MAAPWGHETSGISDLRAHMQRVHEDLPPALQRVARLVSQRGAEVAASSLDEIASGAGVSRSAVVRFCQAIGFDGFRKFKQALIHTQLHAADTSEGPAATPSQSGTHVPADPHVLLSRITAAMQSNARLAHFAHFPKAVRMLNEAKSILWYGTGDSGFLAMSGDHRCAINGLSSRAANVPEVFRNHLPLLSADDVIVCVSRSGRTPSVLGPMREAKSITRAPIVLITGDPGSPVAQLADVVLASAAIDVTLNGKRTTLQSPTVAIIDTLVASVLRTRFGERPQMRGHLE